MTEGSVFRVRTLRRSASRMAFALALACFAGCSAQSQAPDEVDPNPGAPELIDGQPASADQFRATVGINDDCSAAKVGARLFLTAAHCVALGRSRHGTPPPDDYP